jgi:hypothetical protein
VWLLYSGEAGQDVGQFFISEDPETAILRVNDTGRTSAAPAQLSY